MFSFARVLSFASLVVAVSAQCSDGSEGALLSKKPFIDGVKISVLSCGEEPVAADHTVKRDTVDDCGAFCSISCVNTAGVLPPISEDCQRIVDAITIFGGTISDDFNISPFTLQQLTFGTCRYFVENLSNQPITYCWSSFASQASEAGTACFPPHQPLSSEGDCRSFDGNFIVGASHS